METATTSILPLSLHDALPICDDDLRRVVIVDRQLAEETWPGRSAVGERLLLPSATAPPSWVDVIGVVEQVQLDDLRGRGIDRKRTRLNSSHSSISYAVFCLKK